MKKYLLGYVIKTDTLELFANEKAAYNNAEDWCVVEANSLEQAKKQYEKTFTNWQRKQRKQGK